MKKTFTQYLLEQIAPTGHSEDNTPHIKADIVDLIRGHNKDSNSEVLFGSLNRQGKEKELFNYYFNKLNQKYGIAAIKDIKLFRNTLTIAFHAPKLKTGHYLKVYSVLPDEKMAKELYTQLESNYNKKI